MSLPGYKLKTEESLMIYEFTSEGIKGKIHKVVRFTLMNNDNLYNLAFGDKKPGLGDELDDEVTSNNGDAAKVLMSVGDSVDLFTRKYSSAWVYATGSTKARTRLYQMAINKYWNEIKEWFNVYGLSKGKWTPFLKGVNYEAFLIQRK